MIIKTDNERIATLLSSVCLRMQEDGEWSTATATAKQLDGLCSVLAKPDYAGQWSVQADEVRPAVEFETLTVGVDGSRWQSMLLAPGAIGADSEDLITFVENVYQLPVTNENWQRVLQLFRLWYAATAPGEYHEPQWRDASASGLWLSLRYVTKDSGASAQQRRYNRLKDAANSVGFQTIDKLAAAIMAATEEQQRMIEKILKGE